eukprot:765903-Hanusia_phi.AAC.2
MGSRRLVFACARAAIAHSRGKGLELLDQSHPKHVVVHKPHPRLHHPPGRHHVERVRDGAGGNQRAGTSLLPEVLHQHVRPEREPSCKQRSVGILEMQVVDDVAYVLRPGCRVGDARGFVASSGQPVKEHQDGLGPCQRGRQRSCGSRLRPPHPVDGDSSSVVHAQDLSVIDDPGTRPRQHSHCHKIPEEEEGDGVEAEGGPGIVYLGVDQLDLRRCRHVQQLHGEADKCE